MKNLLVLLMTTINGLKDHFDNAVTNSEEPSEAQIAAGLSKFFRLKDDQIVELTNKAKVAEDQVKELTTKIKAQDDAVIKATLDIAEKETQKITNEQRLELEKQVPKIGLDGLNAILATMKPRTNLRNALEIIRDPKVKEEGKTDLPKPTNMREMVARKIAELNAQDAAAKK